MGEVTQEIAKAISSLNFSKEDVALLESKEGRKIFDKLLSNFVRSGDRRWWWEDFKKESFSFIQKDKPFEILNEVIPFTNEKVWLMVEDDLEDFYPIYEIRAEIIKDIVGECFGFEYYIIDKQMDWLICENHHNRLIGIGEKVKIKNLHRIEIKHDA